MLFYICGPMTGRPWFNFPAFDAARDRLLAEGHQVLSPADMDREAGFDAMTLPADHDWSVIPADFDAIAAFDRDVEAVKQCDSLYMLNGWEQSTGAQMEYHAGRWLKKAVQFEAQEPITLQAHRLVRGDRNKSYGNPRDDFRRTAAMWTALTNFEYTFRPEQVAQFMIAVKQSRLCQTPNHRDSWADTAGYAECGAWCMEP